MADIILSLAPAQEQRLLQVFGKYWGLTDANRLPRDATILELKEFLVGHLRNVVRQQERRTAEEALPPITDLIVT